MTPDGSPNGPPTVQLTAPAAGAAFTAPATLQLAATASDPENGLTSVQFYAGTTLLGTDSSAPYAFTWSGVAAGSYSITAVARDNDGATAASEAVGITVTAAPPPPSWKVAFTASPDHDALVMSYQLEVFAAGADPNTATPLATNDLGKPVPGGNQEIIIDRTTFLEGLAAGSYVLTVRAVGAGGSSRSSPYTFTR
jgi:hypothetical protein